MTEMLNAGLDANGKGEVMVAGAAACAGKIARRYLRNLIRILVSVDVAQRRHGARSGDEEDLCRQNWARRARVRTKLNTGAAHGGGEGASKDTTSRMRRKVSAADFPQCGPGEDLRRH